MWKQRFPSKPVDQSKPGEEAGHPPELHIELNAHAQKKGRCPLDMA
jgi:hypothetical protein